MIFSVIRKESSLSRRRRSTWPSRPSRTGCTWPTAWGQIGDALESLAEHPRGAQMFYAKIDRSDAIFMVFMFLLLTPIALVAIGFLIAFIGAVLTGFLEATYHRPGMPDWISTLCVYLLLAVVALLTRSIWSPHAVGLASLIARSMIAASR